MDVKLKEISDLDLYRGILENYKTMTPEVDRNYRYEMWRRYSEKRHRVDKLIRAVEILSSRVEEREQELEIE